MIEKIRKLLEGRKTYLVAIGAIITALIGLVNGVSLSDTIQIIITAILGMTIRAGITTSESK